MGHIPPLSFKAFVTLAAYRLVGIATASAANYVGYADTTTIMPLGVTTDTVLDTSSAVPVSGPGNIAKLSMGDSCAVGAYVKGGANGQGLPIVLSGLTTTGAHAWVAGVMVGPGKVEVTGTVADIFFLPFAVR